MPIPGGLNKPPRGPPHGGKVAVGSDRARGQRVVQGGLAARWVVGGGALLLGLCLSGGVAAKQGDRLVGYGDFRFGMTLAEIQGLIGDAPLSPEDGLDAIETAETIAGMAATRRLLLDDRRLVGILFQWRLEDAAGKEADAACKTLFTRLLGQLSARYGPPALGPDRGTPIEPAVPGASFAGASFWSFFDGASVALIVRRTGAPCRATLNYRAPPPG